MIRAAGILFVAGDTALFLRRGNGADHPNEWCCPGGKLEDGETPENGAIRETFEEAGVHIKESELALWTRTLAPAETPLEQLTVALPADQQEAPAPSEDVDFTTYLVKVSHQFTPKLDIDEHDGFAWAPITAPPQPLHPGVQVSLERFKMDELAVAHAISDGRLTSPQKYENVDLVAMRITGTGAAYRHARQEFVWRDPSIYMNDEFLARCNGLPVIWEHPDKSLLNSEEFSDRIVGTIMFAYIREDKPSDVWGVARIYDSTAQQAIRENVLSTSPAVNFADPTENDRVTLENGQVMLIEGKPSLLDHLALCENGVWDCGGPPTGVDSIDAVADSSDIQIKEKSSSTFNLLRAHIAASTLNLKVR